MSSLGTRLDALHERIKLAAAAAGRPAGAVRLIAVSKTVPYEQMLVAYRLGLRDFAESYVQEALPKLAALAHCDITWHFIGPIQSNKTRPIAERFHWAHSVDRLKIAERLHEQRPHGMPPLNICLQVNVSGEPTKAGVTLDALPQLTEAIAPLSNLRLRGLMAIPAPGQSPDAQRAAFRCLREALLGLNLPGLDTLSIGMSDDLEAAIMEGATLLRIGTALFGPRQAGSTPTATSSQHRAPVS
ncbi:YggS family pyridoxal phosphate-dependent enzyme [Methylotetracoccus oryzae]|uniref:YggS family pyridoxal phosphate-dependent enzyme n=1 Tax=Methylotetracoccus oryzae TaxID=1919059 RepID=UPI00111A4C44|nr:YggS family pyridoxal phosphate-dependent enzyme [Methylotetracoccus oryzae]